jgi:hypothetical protein
VGLHATEQERSSPLANTTALPGGVVLAEDGHMDSNRRITVSHKTMCCMKHRTELKLVGDVALYRALEIGNGDAYAAAFSLEGNFAERCDQEAADASRHHQLLSSIDRQGRCSTRSLLNASVRIGR